MTPDVKLTTNSNALKQFTPTAEIPEREAWLFKNLEALASARRGIADAEAGRAQYVVSFAQYANLDIDDE